MYRSVNVNILIFSVAKYDFSHKRNFISTQGQVAAKEFSTVIINSNIKCIENGQKEVCIFPSIFLQKESNVF